MRHTIAVCTAGKRDSLRDTIHALRTSIATDLASTTEVLLVHGPAETTATMEMLMADSFGDTSVSWQVLNQPAGGVGGARNLALAKATGDVLSFVDDDICPRGPGWQEAILDAFARRSDVGLLGGPVACVVPTGVPSHPWWRCAKADALLSCCAENVSRSTDPRFIWGANASYRLSATAGLQFPVVLGWGSGGPFPLAGEETWFNCRLADRGWVAWYEARAVVEHHVEPERFRPAWVLRRAVTEGYTVAVLRIAEGAAVSEVRRRARRGFLLAAISAAGHVLRLHPRKGFARCLEAAAQVGVFTFPAGELHRVVEELLNDRETKEPHSGCGHVTNKGG